MADLPALAEIGDLELRLMREFVDPEDVRVEQVLNDASDLVRDESGKDWLDPDDPTKLVSPLPRIVRLITLRVAERAVRNPEGFSSESAGDYSYQRNGAVGEGGLYLTAREIAQLRRAGGKSGLWTQQVTRGDLHAQNTRWMEDSFGFELFPVDVLDDCL